ncbi:hypothetical protein LJB89_01330 [Tyzzerella sp. OttesenSCG-928-J15]|nr:hypothetical protein [Tyzzerella sp. OttesenSCG-928-J15]
MKIFTFNGPKAAYNIFACVCLLAIVYFGFVKDMAVAVSSEPVKTTYLAIIIDDFGNGGRRHKRVFIYGYGFYRRCYAQLPLH